MEKRNMRIVKIIGGLGNQMFQFALALSLQHRFEDEEVKLDLHCFRGYRKHYGFELPRIFNIRYAAASLREIARVAYPYPNYLSWKAGHRLLPARRAMLVERADMKPVDDLFDRTSIGYYDGYWQHESYFSAISERVRAAFVFPELTDERNRAVLQTVTTGNSVGIHVRRGDYLTDPLFRGTCPAGYYDRAISLAEERLKPDVYVVFSNDMAWCRQYFATMGESKKVLFVDWNRGQESYRDMQLMSLCRHQIIANSSFSWWAAWLNRNAGKTVIGPAKWMNLEGASSPMCADWLQV